ncbi:MAG: hypothetical protein R3B52_02150 [Candidatus Paceibacterota bacterium]
MNESDIFQKEIESLEQKLQEKKKEAAEKGMAFEEKPAFSEVLKDHIQEEAQSTSEFVAHDQTQQVQATAPNTQLTDQAQQALNHLLEESLTKGIAKAVADARKTGDAYIVDSLHDKLVDEYYEKLLQARKIDN